jgi:adenosine deaminase
VDAAPRDRLVYLQRLPKVELHPHLEGAIPLPALWELVRKHGGAVEVPTVDALAAKFRYRDFEHLVETWVWKNQFLREYDDFTFVAAEVARDPV